MKMRAEFFNGDDGRVWVRQDGKCYALTPSCCDIIEQMVDVVGRIFPATFARLSALYGASRRNVGYFKYRIVERFIRCNMGADNERRMDVDDGRLNLERVSCPLRGICDDEGVVCCPTAASAMTKEEQKAAVLYSKGFTIGEIARLLRKSLSTVNNQLCNVSKRLGLRTRHEVINVCRNYNLL